MFIAEVSLHHNFYIDDWKTNFFCINRITVADIRRKTSSTQVFAIKKIKFSGEHALLAALVGKRSLIIIYFTQHYWLQIVLPIIVKTNFIAALAGFWLFSGS